MAYMDFVWHFRGVPLLVLTLFVAGGVSAKRKPAPIVKPVIHNGVSYSASGDGRTEFVVARDATGGEELWRAKIYSVWIDPSLPGEHQIFISGLKLAGERLLIRDEAGRCYQLDLSKRSARGVSCSVYRAAPISKEQ
ncbi:MAG: hypothetical protein WAN12_11305 [Candidatus Acidiferrum sp.]